MTEKPKKTVKCAGRFHELREYLYNDVLPIVIDERTILSRGDLESTWGLIENDVLTYDPRDSYFDSKIDSLRKTPEKNALSLVPLIEHPQSGFDTPEIIRDYCASMGNHPMIAEQLAVMGAHPRRFLQDVLSKEPKDIRIPGEDGKERSLSGYMISGNFGIGTISPGGMSGGGVRSDSPFLLEVYQPKNKGELDLAAVIGFWAQDNIMLVSQMQSCKNGQYPGGVKFGVGSLRVAEGVAQALGFEAIYLYTARGHPIFKEHPDSWNQYGKEFVCMWDNSAKKLGYTGSRNGGDYHSKKFSSRS